MANPHDHAAPQSYAAGARPASDRILIVEADPAISDLLGRQVLQAVGYQVQVATDASSAITRALSWSPDLILIDLNLPGLSGKDLMVALASQGIQAPLVVVAGRGAETDLIQTFRLGAADFLLLPVREAEVIHAVNRVLKQVHDRYERERLTQQLQQANQELQLRVRELTTTSALGRALAAITDQADLPEKILDASLRTTQADLGWLLFREDSTRPFSLVAERNLPALAGVNLFQPWDDGISSLVAMSGELLSIHGEALRRFKVSALGRSALIAPIKSQKTVLGLLVVLRRAEVPFGASEQRLVNGLADYASVSFTNARLVRSLEEQVRTRQQKGSLALLANKVNSEILRTARAQVSAPLSRALAALNSVAQDPASRLSPPQRQQLLAARNELQFARRVTDGWLPAQVTHGSLETEQDNLGELLAQSLRRLEPFTQAAGITCAVTLPQKPLFVAGEASLLANALVGLLGFLCNFAGAGARLAAQLEEGVENQAHLAVTLAGRRIPAGDAERLFSAKEPAHGRPAAGEQPCAPAVSPALVKEILGYYRGRIWVSNQAGESPVFHIMLPLAHDRESADG